MTTKLTPEQIQIMKDDIATALIGYLMEDFHYSWQEALDILYTSETCERLQDNETGLSYHSPGYVYSFVENEVKTAVVM